MYKTPMHLAFSCRRIYCMWTWFIRRNNSPWCKIKTLYCMGTINSKLILKPPKTSQQLINLTEIYLKTRRPFCKPRLIKSLPFPWSPSSWNYSAANNNTCKCAGRQFILSRVMFSTTDNQLSIILIHICEGEKAITAVCMHMKHSIKCGC